MTPQTFPEANINFVAPPGLEESQCMTIGGFQGRVRGGSLDGAPVSVVAWKPTQCELELIKEGKPIFLSFIGGIPPHFPSMSFEEAIKPA